MKIRNTLIQFFLLLFTITVYAQNVDKTKDIGEISYSSSSTPTGAFTYDVPINVYPGKNGTQPNLSLSYNSQNLNLFSVLGVGWSLGGLSEISRSQTNQYYDNITTSSPIKEDINVFTLDGIRLVNSSNTNYTYQTEEGNIYIKVKDNYTKFEVYYPNGAIAYYGLGTHKYSYPITKLVDPLGNYVDYTYSSENNRFYIDQISYSSNENIEIGKIKFVYKQSDFEKFVYIDGLQIKTTKRISDINCYFGSSIQHSYSIDYKKSGNNYFLEKLNYSSLGKYLNPLTFEYGNGLKSKIENSINLYPTNAQMVSIPVNWNSQVSREGYFLFPSNLQVRSNMYIYHSASYTQSSEAISLPDIENVLVGDIDGDLDEEVIMIHNSYPDSKNDLWFRTIKEFDFSNKIFNQFWIKDFPENRTFLLGDFLGKGKADLLMIAYAKDSKGNSRNAIATFIDFEKKTKGNSNYNFLKVLPEDHLLLIDFDGDGAVELLVISRVGTSVYKIDSSANYTLMASLPINKNNIALDIAHTAIGTSKILIADINNDGKTDIVVSPQLSVRGKCYVHMGTCKGGCIRQASAEDTFKSKGASFDEIWMGPPGQQCLVRGVEDCFTTDGGTTWTIYLSNGKNKFETKTFSGSRNMSSIISQSPDQFTLFDVNGDNLLDLIRVSEFDKQITAYYNQEGTFSSNATYIDATKIERGTLSTTNGAYRYGNHGKGFAISNDKTIATYYDVNADKNQLLMTKAVSSYGSIITLEYAKIDNYLAYDKYYSKDEPIYPWAKIPYGMDLLRNRKDSVNTVKTNDLDFKYTHGLVHLQGLGFKGFEKIETGDNIDNTRSTTQEFDPKNWSVLKTQKSSTSEGSYEYNYVIDANKARTVTLKNKTEKDLLKNLSVTTSYIYDTYGNPTKETVLFADKIEKVTDIEYNNFITGTPYLLGQVKTKTVTNKLDALSASTKTLMEYYANNQLKSKKSYYAGNLVSEETYIYDNYNNLSQSKSKAYTSTNELISNTIYDNIGRLKQQTDPLGLYIDYIYNNKGQLETIKNYKGQETKYEYDSWGRKVKTTYPDGTIESIKMDWTSNIADLGNLDANSNYGDLKIGTPLAKGTSVVACHSISLTPGFSHKASDKGTLSLKIDLNSCSNPPTPSSYNNSLYVVTATKTGSPTSKVYYDALGRELRKGELRFDGRYLYTDVVYDYLGRVKKQSLPFKGNTPSLWDTYNYDKYNQMTSLSYASGKKDSIRYVNNSIISIIDSIETTKKYNVLGQVETVTDPAGTITYIYRPDGQPEFIIPPRESKVSESVIKTSFEYDGYGRQTAIIDPSAGRRSFGYDASGNINKETDADNKVTDMVYDKYNRIYTKTVDGITTTYKYDLKNGLLQSISNTNRVLSYTYDNLDRLLTEKDSIIDKKYLQKTFAYSNGNVSSVAYKSQSGDIVTQNYGYANGHNTEMKLNNSISIWKLTAENSLGMPTNATTGALTRTYGYTNFGLPTSRVVKNGSAFIQNFGYDIDPNTKNLNWRKDNIRNITENFKYDGLNRLETISGKDNYRMAYDVMGNITNNGSVGQFEYKHGTKPYALTDATSNIIPAKIQNIQYNAQLRPTSISENGYLATLSYNGNGDRIKMLLNKGTVNQLTRYYIGQYEIDGGIDGDKERLYLDGDAYSAAAVYVKQNGKWDVQYICRDHLGSITHVTNSAGILLQELSYDPWGRLRDPADQKEYAVYSEPTPILGRGYTGHEHLPTFGLINMNARLYDPVVGRFLAPDPYVQAPDMSQNFNRYSYALNNPLLYTDPSGKFAWAPILIAAVQFGLQSGAEAKMNKGNFLDGFWKGAVASAAGAYIGTAIKPFVDGVGFLSGFISGGVSGFASGFIYGSLDSWSSGSGFGGGLKSGFSNGFSSGLTAGTLSGVVGGLEAISSHGNFFTGIGYSKISELAFDGDYNFSGTVEDTDKMLQEQLSSIGYKNGRFNISKIEMAGRSRSFIEELGINYGTDANGYITNAKYEYINGFTYSNKTDIFSFGKSSIYLSPHINYNDLKYTLNHELIHAYHYSILDLHDHSRTEYSAYKYSYSVTGSSFYKDEMDNMLGRQIRTAGSYMSGSEILKQYSWPAWLIK